MSELNKRVNTEESAHRADVILNRCPEKFRSSQRKTTALESVFNKVAGLQLSCKYCEFFKSRFFHKIPPVAASEKFLNLPGKHQWRRRNRFTFLINMIE